MQTSTGVMKCSKFLCGIVNRAMSDNAKKKSLVRRLTLVIHQSLDVHVVDLATHMKSFIGVGLQES